MGNATVLARHLEAAVIHHWTDVEEAPEYVRRWLGGEGVICTCDGVESRILADLGRTAQLIANSERYGRNDEREDVANWLTLCRGLDELGSAVYAGVHHQELERIT